MSSRTQYAHTSFSYHSFGETVPSPFVSKHLQSTTKGGGNLIYIQERGGEGGQRHRLPTPISMHRWPNKPLGRIWKNSYPGLSQFVIHTTFCFTRCQHQYESLGIFIGTCRKKRGGGVQSSPWILEFSPPNLIHLLLLIYIFSQITSLNTKRKKRKTNIFSCSLCSNNKNNMFLSCLYA